MLDFVDTYESKW